MGICSSSSKSTSAVPEAELFVLPSRPDGFKQKLWVLLAHFNPKGYQTRIRLLRATVARLMKDKKFFAVGKGERLGLDLEIMVAELVYDDAPSEFTAPEGCHYIRRSVSKNNVMWSKEQLLNIGIKAIPDGDYVAWIDGDIEFKDPTWALHAVSSLLASPRSFVQLFRTANLLDPKGKTFETVSSFAYQHSLGKPYASVANTDSKNYWHPGFAWAASKATLTSVGFLLDRTLGSADLHMACACLEDEVDTIPAGVNAGYKSLITEWQKRCRDNRVKLVCTSYKKPISHHWHGTMKNRQYVERWQIVIENDFDPTRDCRFDDDLGLYVYSDECSKMLITQLNEFFDKRAEDSTDTAGDRPAASHHHEAGASHNHHQHDSGASHYDAGASHTHTHHQNDGGWGNTHNSGGGDSKPSYWGGYA